jgi:glycosyltransferase involved in cell wall biosynthesis
MAEAKKKIAVCDLITSFGGVQRVMANLLPRLAEEFEIIVIDPYANSDYIRQLEKAGIRLYFTKPSFKKPYIGGHGTWKRVPLMVSAVSRLFKIRAMFNPDYIYVNQLSLLHIMVTVRRLYKIPLIYHCHGPNRHGDFKPADISRLSARIINSLADIVIAVSHSTMNVIQRAGVDPTVIQVCHNAVNIEEIERHAKGSLIKPLPDKKTGQVVFLLPAAIQHRKGHHLAIKALSHLVKSGYDVVLWFSGDVMAGGNKQYLNELHSTANALGIKDSVYFLGWRSDIYRVMSESDVVMLCSLSDSESFGMALAEGMVLCKPCIGARIGGIPEVILNNQTGLLFEPGSYSSLAKAMATLASDRETREKFGQAGCIRVKELFNIDIQAGRVVEIINMVSG